MDMAWTLILLEILGSHFPFYHQGSVYCCRLIGMLVSGASLKCHSTYLSLRSHYFINRLLAYVP